MTTMSYPQTLSYTLSDSATMLRRMLRHSMRYPSLLLATVVIPTSMLLFFVYAFGGALTPGLAGQFKIHDYLDYIAPGIFMLSMTAAAMATSIGVATDMTKGIINRFRTMGISRASVLTGHVLGSVIQAMISVVILIGVAMAIGFRPHANAGAWIAAFGLMALVSFALTWLAVGFGLMAKTVDTASNTPMILQLLPFLSSAFVPPAAMASGLRWFAEHQPFTPINDTLRGLLLGSQIGDKWIISIAWCLGMALVGYLWSRRLYRRDPVRTT
jgi:ABC-2 type transport system permease protein